jgi:hypothetical protein
MVFGSMKNGKSYCEGCFPYAAVCRCENCLEDAGYKYSAYSTKHEMYLCKECKENLKNK